MRKNPRDLERIKAEEGKASSIVGFVFGRITFFAVDSTLSRSRDSFSWNPCKAALITKSVSRTPRHQNTTRANRQVRLPPNMLSSHIAIQGGQASLSQNPLPSTLPPHIPHGPNREKTIKTRSNNARGLSRQTLMAVGLGTSTNNTL